jgi:DNA repair and recombination protein RAD52
MKLAYVESWKAIELANTIFGFDGWSSTIVDITPDFIEETKQGKFRVGVSALVKVGVLALFC